MGRKTATYIHCDSPKCKVYFQADEENSGMVPENWLTVILEKDGRYAGEKFEFHSEKCLSDWARLRHQAKNGRLISRSTPVNRDLRQEIREAFTIEPGAEMTVADVVAVTGREKTSIYKEIKRMVQDGEIFILQKSKGTIPAKYKLNT